MGFFLSFPRYIDSAIAGLEEVGRTWRGKFLRLIQIRFSDAEFGKISPARQAQFATSPNRRFKFQKRSQLFIRAYNKTLSVIAMGVSNPDCSAFAVHG
jgi:hypothetical protein